MRISARLPSEDIANTSLWSLLRSWLRVLIVAGFSGAAAFTALALAPPRYSATTEIRLAAPASKGVVAATVAALQSNELARKLVADLGLAGSHAFNGASVTRNIFGRIDGLTVRNARLGAASGDQAAAAAFRQSLSVAPDIETGLVAISVTAETPELAIRTADHLVDIYLAAAAPTATTSPAVAPAAAGHHIARLTEEVATLEAEIARLAGRADGATQAQRRDDLVEALAQAERERSDAESRARAVRALLDKGKVEAIAELQTSPTLHQLIAERVRTEVQKSGAARSLASDHPRFRDLQARLSELRWQMFREATAIADGLDAEVRTAAARQADAQSRLTSIEARVSSEADATDLTDRLAALEQEAAAKRRAIARYAAGDQTAEVSATGTVAAPAVAERTKPAEAEAIAAFPRKGQLALLTAVSVLMIGFVAVILRILLASAHRPIAVNGHASMAATARDRADVRLDARPAAARPADEVRPAGEVRVAATEPAQFVIVSTTDDVARHIAGRAVNRKGYRTLLVSDGIDGAGEARDVLSSLATAGRRCVLVEWSRDGSGIAASLGMGSAPGFNELLDGRAGFDDVIVRLPGSDAHFIPAGALPSEPARPLDPDWINLVLDALDEAYDHIVVVARLDEARTLFETIEGRFDVGIVMSDRRGQGPTINAGPGVFLGFEVTEIYIVQMDLAQRPIAGRRLKRAQRRAAA